MPTFNYDFLLYTSGLLTLYLIAVTDWRWMVIPDKLVYGMLFLGTLKYVSGLISMDRDLSLLVASLHGGIVCLVTVVITQIYHYTTKRGRSLLGWGDVKLLSFILMWFSVWQIGEFFIVCGVSALVFALMRQEERVPMAPSIALSFVVCLL